MAHLWRRRSGQSMVEFAVLAPIFFLLLLGTIDLGRAIYVYNSISDAAREGARAAVPFDSPLPSNTSVVSAVQAKLGGGFTLRVDPCLSTGTTCPTPGDQLQPNTGYIWYSNNIGRPGRQSVTIQITYMFQPWVPVVRDAAGNGLPLTARSTMVTEY